MLQTGVPTEEEAYAAAHAKKLDKEERASYLRRETQRRMASELAAAACAWEVDTQCEEQWPVAQAAGLLGPKLRG